MAYKIIITTFIFASTAETSTLHLSLKRISLLTKLYSSQITPLSEPITQMVQLTVEQQFLYVTISNTVSALLLLTNQYKEATSTQNTPNGVTTPLTPEFQSPNHPTFNSKYKRTCSDHKAVLLSLNTTTPTNVKLSLARERYENNITKLQSTYGSLWHKTKNILNHKELIPPIKLPNNKLAISDLEKSNTFAEYFNE
ncbi:hypothetical protein AGLY_006484, partial [Aphis glycines]